MVRPLLHFDVLARWNAGDDWDLVRNVVGGFVVGCELSEGKEKVNSAEITISVATYEELISRLQITTRFLSLEAEGHRFRQEPKKAEPCERQVAANEDFLLSLAGGCP